MLRSTWFAVAVATFLSASGSALAAATPTPTPAAPAAEPLNIGFALYTKSETPGALSATWNYSNAYSGPGLATGGPATGGFAGRFHVRYFLQSGQFSDEYDLIIERHGVGGFYDVTWLVDGKVSARGVGMEVAEGKSLAVGWRRVDK